MITNSIDFNRIIDFLYAYSTVCSKLERGRIIDNALNEYDDEALREMCARELADICCQLGYESTGCEVVMPIDLHRELEMAVTDHMVDRLLDRSIGYGPVARLKQRLREKPLRRKGYFN